MPGAYRTEQKRIAKEREREERIDALLWEARNPDRDVAHQIEAWDQVAQIGKLTQEQRAQFEWSEAQMIEAVKKAGGAIRARAVVYSLRPNGTITRDLPT